MTNAPADLLAFRYAVMAETGLTDPADVGIVGDGAHQHTGGYHEGRDVLILIGRYHPGTQYIGSSGEDYSARLARDRNGLTDDASALDIGAQWPRGGRAAWLRLNGLLVRALQANDPALAAIRAINYSPDGTSRHRIDREYGWQVQDSTDSVDIHTHFEWYRDTDGRRQASLDRLIQLIRAARDNTTPPPATTTPRRNRMLIAHEKGSTQYYIGDGVTRRAVTNLVDVQNVLRGQGYTEQQVQPVEFWPGTLPALGDLVSAPAPVALTADQVTALGTQVGQAVAAPIADLAASVKALTDRLAAAAAVLAQPPA